MNSTESGRQAASGSRPPAGALPWIFAAAGCVAALVIGFAGYRVMHPLGAPSVFAAAARDHHAEVVDRQPGNWQTARASINELAAQQGLPAGLLGAFAPGGFRLEQGKVSLLDNLPYLHLVYTNGEQRFSLFLRQEQGTPNHDSIDTANLGPDHVAAFHHGPLSVIIVTDEPGDEASHLARFAAAVFERP
jgi:hypothetical protein